MLCIHVLVLVCTLHALDPAASALQQVSVINANVSIMDQPQIPRPSAGQMMAMSNHIQQFEAGQNAATTTGARAFVGVATAHDDARIEVIAEQRKIGYRMPSPADQVLINGEMWVNRYPPQVRTK